MKNNKAIGIAGDSPDILRHYSAKDFSDDHYEGMTLYSDKAGKPVVILMSRTAEAPVWKVLCGTSDFYFRRYGEVVDFCNQRGFTVVSLESAGKGETQ